MPIVIDPGIARGKPVIQGTRVPVATVLEQLAAGLPVDDLARDFGITVQDVRDALAYAGELVNEAQVSPLPG
jgi:uncharacterized protein (DUF433 family)